MSSENDFNAGRIAALEQAVKRLVWRCPAPELLIAELREVNEEREGVVELNPLPPNFVKGFAFTTDVLSRGPEQVPPARL